MVTVTMEVNSLGKLAGNGIAHLRLLLLSSHVLTVSEVVLTVSQKHTMLHRQLDYQKATRQTFHC